MCRSIVVGIAILALSTSAALAAHRTHHHVMKVSAAAPAASPPPAIWMGGMNSNDHATYLKNLRDSGYNPKNDYKDGLIRTN